MNALLLISLRRALTIIRAYLFEEENGIDSARQVELDENVEKMKQLGQRTARIVLKQSLRPLTTLNKEDGPFLTHIPLPRDTGKVAKCQDSSDKRSGQAD